MNMKRKRYSVADRKRDKRFWEILSDIRLQESGEPIGDLKFGPGQREVIIADLEAQANAIIKEVFESNPEMFVKLPDGRYCARAFLHTRPKADVLSFKKPDDSR
jgi:hypothetical protein